MVGNGLHFKSISSSSISRLPQGSHSIARSSEADFECDGREPTQQMGGVGGREGAPQISSQFLNRSRVGTRRSDSLHVSQFWLLQLYRG